MSEYIVNLLTHSTGSIFQHMGKCLIFPVYIGKEMLRTFRQVDDRLEVNDLCGRFLNSRI